MIELVQSADEVGEAVRSTKANGIDYRTNFYLTPPKLQRWISHGELFCERQEGVALFLKRDRGFWRLYFCATNDAALQKSIAALALLRIDSAVVDLVGQESAVDGLVDLFTAAGFRRYRQLFRMARTVRATSSDARTPDAQVIRAGEADSQSILDLLLASFDCRAEQLPMLYEIEAALGAGQILLVRCDRILAGLLFFETQGLTSTLRYWLVAPEYRARQFGSALIHRYFALHHAVRRYVLWVIADNETAICKYRHYDFASDGLIDQVMSNEMARS